MAAFEQGEDVDKESGLNHMAHVAWNALGLVTYSKTHPNLDDRRQSYLTQKKIGLDIDEVLCDWLTDWCSYWKLNVPHTWFFDRDILSKFKTMQESGKLDGFYLNLKPLIDPKTLPFEPHCYVTSRPVETAVTEQWLTKHGFPERPVISVPVGTSKVDVLKEAGVEIFIDDRYDNFVEINNAGICCFLMDAPHNQRYNVGYKRILNFDDFKQRFL